MWIIHNNSIFSNYYYIIKIRLNCNFGPSILFLFFWSPYFKNHVFGPFFKFLCWNLVSKKGPKSNPKLKKGTKIAVFKIGEPKPKKIQNRGTKIVINS